MLHALLVQAAVACAAPAPLPPELAGWSPQSLTSATAKGDQVLPIGQGVIAALRPTSKVMLAAPVAKPPARTTFSGVFAFTVPAAGRYRVALGSAAWLDVVRDNKVVGSVAHDHGPACSPVRKMVDFDLQQGRYRLQIVGSTAPVITMLVTKLP